MNEPRSPKESTPGMGLGRAAAALALFVFLAPAHGRGADRVGAQQSAESSLALAESEFTAKHCSLAVHHYANAGTLLQHHPDAVVHYAECAAEQDFSKTSAILKLLAPGDGEHHFEAGEMLVRHQAYETAAAEFGLARQTYKDPYVAGYDQALAYFQAGEFSKTIDTANDLLNQGHRTAELANLAGEAYLKNKQPKEAYNALRLATGLDPKNEDSYVDLCSLALSADDYDLGIEIANVGLSHVPGSARLYLQRGVLHAMKGQFDEAQQDFSAAGKIAPQDPSPRVSEGVLAMQRGDLDHSIELLRQASTLAPDNYLAEFWLAEALLRSGVTPDSKEGNEALAALQRSVHSNPEFWHSQTDLGKVLMDRGDLDAAIGHLEKAAALNPAATNPLYLLSQIYRRKGETARAQELIARVSRMQEQDREALARSDLKDVASQGTGSQIR
jgi:tetratricopeptide (TPR) repeat protein